MDTYRLILEKGKFYFPASKHYGESTNVICDRCGRANLSACIGYKEEDLCMICIDTLVTQIPVPPPQPQPQSQPQSQPPPELVPAPKYKPRPRTRMLQRFMAGN